MWKSSGRRIRNFLILIPKLSNKGKEINDKKTMNVNRLHQNREANLDNTLCFPKRT